jgi:hypothetical protein
MSRGGGVNGRSVDKPWHHLVARLATTAAWSVALIDRLCIDNTLHRFWIAP